MRHNKQYAIIIDSTNPQHLLELNNLLNDGWFVFKMCQMNSSAACGDNLSVGGLSNNYSNNYSSMVSYPPTCLVILEKNS